MTNLRKGQVRLGPRTWVVIREAYLGGASAASLAETYGCSLGTIRWRAREEGWRRCDTHEGEPVARAGPAEPEATETMTPEAIAEMAIAAAGRALRAGRPSEAAAYMRVAEAARRTSQPEPEPELPPSSIDHERSRDDFSEMRRAIRRRIDHLMDRQREAQAADESDWD